MTAHHPWMKTKPEQVRGALAAVSWDAAGLWHAVMLYMADTGADGTLPKAKLHVATDRRLPERKIAGLVAELVAEGLLVDLDQAVGAGEHWHQPPVEIWSDDVKRARWQRAKELLRDKSLCNAVKDRDRNLCRYCGIRVNWTDRRGRVGGTYDHVDPDGPNSLDNVVVACRGCNARKKDRTPDQAGMPLYQRGTTVQQIAEGVATLIAASAGQGRSPEPRARSSDQIPIQSGSDRRSGSARAPARDRTDPTRAKSDPDHPRPPLAAVPVAPALPTDDPAYVSALLQEGTSA